MHLLPTLDFLRQLQLNNNREWFNAHRSQYEAARGHFLGFIENVIAGIKEFDSGLGPIEAKDCVFRIYRDVRFSRNKVPYKTNMGAYMARGGKKSSFAGYYFHLDPAGSFLSGGIYMASSDIMKRIRMELSNYPDEFLSIVRSKRFMATYPTFEAESLRRAPQGFSADSPVIDYLKMKHLSPVGPISAEETSSNNLLKSTLGAFRVLFPLLQFFNRAIED